MPIKFGADGRVLGTFGTYYRQSSREPTAREMPAVREVAGAAARALEQARAKK